MGNASGVRSIPQDVTKCSLDQLQLMINSAIINNPWNTENCVDDNEKLKATIHAMALKNLRPITPEEYAQKLKVNGASNKGTPKKPKTTSTIHLWRTLSGEEVNQDIRQIFSRETISSLSNCLTDAESASLPTTTEEAIDILNEMGNFDQDDGRCDTQCDTVEWAAVVKLRYDDDEFINDCE